MGVRGQRPRVIASFARQPRPSVTGSARALVFRQPQPSHFQPAQIGAGQGFPRRLGGGVVHHRDGQLLVGVTLGRQPAQTTRQPLRVRVHGDDHFDGRPFRGGPGRGDSAILRPQHSRRHFLLEEGDGLRRDRIHQPPERRSTVQGPQQQPAGLIQLVQPKGIIAGKPPPPVPLLQPRPGRQPINSLQHAARMAGNEEEGKGGCMRIELLNFSGGNEPAV